MIGRLAFRSLTAHPVRSGVLAAGFGVGVAVMAILLGVAEVVLDQARAPALAGGGDVVVRLDDSVPATLLLSGTLQSDALRDRVEVAAPSHRARLELRTARGTVDIRARGGIPSLEQALGDPETSGVVAWTDSDADRAWTARDPGTALRFIDRFHRVPDAPRWAGSWAEWLYFNGRAGDHRFYLTFLVGPADGEGMHQAGVRLQLEQNGVLETFAEGTRLSLDEALRAPDLSMGGNHVRLDGLVYRITLDLPGRDGRRVSGELSVTASPGRILPPIEIAGAQGWKTGYVVPVMSGALDGTLTVSQGGAGQEATTVDFGDGQGYHDHNWGFWEGVSWQWGQVQREDLSLIYGRVFPPAEAADPERLPGFVGVIGPAGPIGYATNVSITETDTTDGIPRTITIRGRSPALDVTVRFDVDSRITTGTAQGFMGSGLDFLQMRGTYTVSGEAGGLPLDFTAPGAAETFRDLPGLSAAPARDVP